MKRLSNYWKIRSDEIFYLIGFTMVMIVLPLFLPSYLVLVLGLTFIFVVAAVSWDFMTGLVGEVNLGHTIFIGIGGYTTALLNDPQRFKGTFLDPLASLPSLPMPLTIFIGGILATLIGILIGLITLRLKGWYFALVTALLPLLFLKVTYVFKDLFQGEEGVPVKPPLSEVNNALLGYIITLPFMIISILILYGIKNSKLGLTLMAIREDAILAESLGINTYFYKVIAMAISSFFAGLSGAIWAHYLGTMSQDLLRVSLMLSIILAVVIGGLGSIIGPIIGGFLISLLKYWVLKVYLVPHIPKNVPLNDDIVLYLLLIIIAITMPNGIYERLRKLYLTI